MIDKRITQKHIFEALVIIDRDGVPVKRQATVYQLHVNGRTYPPKYVLSIASKLATGRELEPSEFGGGRETNSFLIGLGFEIQRKINSGPKRQKTNIASGRVNICTVAIQSKFSRTFWNNQQTSKKINALEEILKRINAATDILVLPAGFVHCGKQKPADMYVALENAFARLIRQYLPNLVVCFGIDGRRMKDQLAIAINKTGIIAIARKFHHTNKDLDLAASPFTTEHTKERYFILKGKRAYLAVCYDVFGLPHLNLANELKCDFIISVIHGFGKSGGDVDFARKGLAGAAKQWSVPVFASAVFSEDRNPANWPSGVQWIQGNKSVKDCTYESIRIESIVGNIETGIGTLCLRHYSF